MSDTLSVDVDFARQYIDDHVGERQVNKIQHSFPSPRFWRETDVPVDQINRDRRSLLQMERASPVNLYVGVPYCIKTEPSKCGYCLFPVEDFTGNTELEVYFDYLKREAQLYKDRDAFAGQTLGAVYFGGGTSNLYRAEKYPELMSLVRDLFPDCEPGADITLEGIPQLFSRDKLRLCKESGFTSISMGAQQLNEELNALSGRKQTRRHVLQTIEWAHELGLGCNVDIIFGWPRQTVKTMVEDIEALIATGVHDITHYELNVGGPTDFALNRYHELPSPYSNIEMYRVSRDLLVSHGFEQVTAYNWRKPGDPANRRYEEGVTRRFDSMNTIGLGYAAITFFGDVALEDPISWSFINWRNLSNYKEAIDAGRFPVECGFRHEHADFRLCMTFRNLFGLHIDRKAYLSAFGIDALDDFAGVWTALLEREFLRITPERIELIGDGRFFTPMVQALLAENRYRTLRSRLLRQQARAGSLPLADETM